MGMSVGGFSGNPLDEWVHPVSFSSWPQSHSVRKPGSCTGREQGWAPERVWAASGGVGVCLSQWVSEVEVQVWALAF